LISSAEIELFEATVWAQLHGRFALQAGNDLATIERRGRAVMLSSRAADAVAINRAIGFGFDGPLDSGRLADIRAFFRSQGKARWFVECSPDAAIDIATLTAAGGVIGGTQIKLVAAVDALHDLPVSSLDVKQVNASEAPLFMDLVGSQLAVPEPVRPGIVSTIEQPGWHFYFALADEQPVAGAALFVEGDGAWFGLAGTLPEYRQRGAQTALLLQRMRDAKAAGCRWVSAEAFPETFAPNPSLRNMKRLGLRELYHRPWYRFQEHPSRPSA
jgi:GNAT superfamily N-acetyltransferase